MSLNTNEVDKVSFTGVDSATGNISRESRTEASKVTMADRSPFPGADEKMSTDMIVTNSKNVLVSFKVSGSDDADNGVVRIGQASQIVFPDIPVTVGDKWSHEHKGDATLKSHDTHADFENVSSATVAGVATFKIKTIYNELGAKPMSRTGIHVIEIASGDEVSSEETLTGMDLGREAASAKVTAERLDGGSLGGAKPGA